jgi:xanthine dehydrogenase molybdopterin-binding subunit B
MNKPIKPSILKQALQNPHKGVGVSRPHESAHMHVSGSAPYTDDLPELAGTLHAALGLSPVANGVLRAIDLQTIRARRQRLRIHRA